MSEFKLPPLAFSVAGHALCLALLLLLPSKVLPVPEPPAMGGVEVVFETPPPPKIETEPAPQPPAAQETPPPEPEPEQPPPPPPVVVEEPPPPAPEAPVPPPEPPPPPPRKVVAKRPPKPLVRHVETPQPNPVLAAPNPSPAAPQTAAAATPVPAPVPSPALSQGYRALLSAWLESHKRYPDSARQRGEEGRAVLRFVVDRSGRVLDYAVSQSTGYGDLDTAIEEMMRGAMMPPFPPGMTQPRIEVSVTIRFSLAR